MADPQNYGVYFTGPAAQGWELDGRKQPRKFTKAQAERYVALANPKAVNGTYAARRLDED